MFSSTRAWNTITHRPPSTVCPLSRMLLTLKANLRVMLSEGSTPPIRKLSSGKLPNTESSFSSVKRKNVKLWKHLRKNQRNTITTTVWEKQQLQPEPVHSTCKIKDRGGVQTWEWNQSCSPPGVLSAPTVTSPRIDIHYGLRVPLISNSNGSHTHTHTPGSSSYR